MSYAPPPPAASQNSLYDCSDPVLTEARHRARELMFRYNTSPPTRDGQDRKEILAELFCVPVDSLDDVCIEPPLYVDYGSNIRLTGPFYANFNTTILDCAVVTIGKRVLFGPSVSLYPATHGISVQERQTGLERASEITIGDDCWIGGGANIQAGVTLGQGCTVGAGAVVTRSFPDWSVVVGNPARLIKTVPEEERGSEWDPAKATGN